MFSAIVEAKMMTQEGAAVETKSPDGRVVHPMYLFKLKEARGIEISLRSLLAGFRHSR
jgi:hypothetical protein